VVHQFEKEVLFSEDVAVLGGGGQRLRRLAEPQAGLHLTRRAAGVAMIPSACSAMSSRSMRGLR